MRLYFPAKAVLLLLTSFLLLQVAYGTDPASQPNEPKLSAETIEKFRKCILFSQPVVNCLAKDAMQKQYNKIQTVEAMSCSICQSMVSAVETLIRSKMAPDEIKATIFKTCDKSVSVAGESGEFLDKNNKQDLENQNGDPLKKIQPEDIGNICNILMRDIADDMIERLRDAAEKGDVSVGNRYCKDKTVAGKLGGNSICSVTKSEFVGRLQDRSAKQMSEEQKLKPVLKASMAKKMHDDREFLAKDL